MPSILSSTFGFPQATLDGSAATACNTAGITDARARERMALFFDGLRRLGLHDDFVDGACYRPGFQKVSGSFISLKGFAATVTSAPVLCQGGVTCDGVDDVIKHIIPDVGAGGRTTFYWGASKLAATGGTVFLALENAASSINSRHWLFSNTGAYGGAILQVYNGATLGNTAGETFLLQNAPETHMSCGRDTNAGGAGALSFQLDGRVQRTNASGAGINSNALTDVLIGAYKSGGAAIDGWFNTTTASWFVFNKALSDTEINLFRALVESTICPRVVAVIEGDSLSSGTCWANYMPDDPNSWGLVDTTFIGAGGATTVDILASYAAEIRAIKPASGEQKWLFLMAGTNDIANLGSSGATVFANLRTLWAQARADGFKVAALTILMTTGTNTQRAAANVLIRNAPNEYDALIDADRFFFRLAGASYAANTTYFNVDGVHLVAAGWAALGAEADRCMKFQDIPL